MSTLRTQGATRKHVVNLAVLLVTLLLLGTVLELGARLLTGNEPDPVEERPPVIDDPNYGYVFAASSELHASKVRGRHICYDVTYRTDAFGRRTLGFVPPVESTVLLLFGGSVTFGEGLADSDTLQAKLAARLPKVSIHNYAASGYGPSHMLAKVESEELGSELPHPAELALFVLIPWHLSRVIGDTRAHWIYSSPYYDVNPAGQLVRQGSFITGRPVRTAIYQGLVALRSRSHLISSLGLQLPVRIPDSAAELTGRVLIEAARLLRVQMQTRSFVVFHPSWNLADADHVRWKRSLIANLSSHEVGIFDFSKKTLDDSDVISPGCDLHPNGRLNERLAGWLTVELADHLVAGDRHR